MQTIHDDETDGSNAKHKTCSETFHDVLPVYTVWEKSDWSRVSVFVYGGSYTWRLNDNIIDYALKLIISIKFYTYTRFVLATADQKI